MLTLPPRRPPKLPNRFHSMWSRPSPLSLYLQLSRPNLPRFLNRFVHILLRTILMKIKLWNYFQLRESILSSLNYCPYELAHRNIIWSLFLRVFIWAMCQSLIISCTARKNSRMKELLQPKSCVSSSGLCRVCSSIFVLALSVKNDLIMEDMILTSFLSGGWNDTSCKSSAEFAADG